MKMSPLCQLELIHWIFRRWHAQTGDEGWQTGPNHRSGPTHVGSLLRPAALKEARAKREKREITGARLTEIEDREIERIIRKQEEIGLRSATDGEFRRSWCRNSDFWRQPTIRKASRRGPATPINFNRKPPPKPASVSEMVLNFPGPAAAGPVFPVRRPACQSRRA
jgi:hypothetical protein